MKENDKKNKRKKRIGKINLPFFLVAGFALRLIYKFKYGLTIDRKGIKGIKGPAIVLGSHTCDQDHILSGLTFYPVRPTYIVSEHFMHCPDTATLMKRMHVITKKMFTPDVSTILNIMRAVKEKAILFIFPEGRLSCYGHTLYVTDGTAELIKKLGLNVYVWHTEGGYLTFPKWREKGDNRRGKIRCSAKLLMTAEEVEKMELQQIRDIASEAIFNDDELSMQGVEFKSKTIAKGVDKILFKCPVCKKEGTITSEGNHIRCTACNLDATLDNFYRLHDAPFERVNEWFEWQQNSIDTENECLETKARFGCCGKDDMMDENAGEGTIYLDKNVFKFSGTLHGELIEFETEPEKIKAFPITPGVHFDIYHKGKLIYIYPLPDTRMSTKWLCFMDKLMEEKSKAASNT